MRLRWFRICSSIALSLAFAGLASVSVFAENTFSDNYQAVNTLFGAGGDTSCTDTFCAQQTVGDTAVGSSSSSSFGVQAGANADGGPTLEIYVEGKNNDLGIVKSEATATASAAMTVRSYLSSGYVVQLVGTPPKIAEHTITNLAVPAQSQAGTEQFGVNVVKNTNPAVGDDPVQVPDNTFAFGSVADDYATANFFTYNDGDIIVSSNVSSGETDYVMSFILNVAPSTPAGLYTSTLHAVIVPTY